MTKRSYGDGSILRRGEDSFRLRYRIGKQRYSVTFRGTPKEAKTKLRELLRSGDTGEQVASDKMTLGDWIERWLSIGAPGRKKRRVGRRSLERYTQLLRGHTKRLQQLHATDIDQLYEGLECKLAPKTQHLVHTMLGACLNAAVRKDLLTSNPIDKAEKIPSAGESDHGQVLDKEQLANLVQGFRRSALYPIVAVAAFTGARRNEILVLQWSDLDPMAKTLRIERALEETKGEPGQGPTRTLKGPKKESHKRTIAIDSALVDLLLSVREKHLRLGAGVRDGAGVDLSLIKLPEGALMFPTFASRNIDFTKLRDAKAVTNRFQDQVRRRFPKLRFHGLRGSHETALLDAGVPVHVVAARCGHDPAMLLRVYAKRTKADTSAAAVIASIAKAILGTD